MSDFWSRQLNGTPAQPQQQPQYRPPSRPQRAWWQDDEPEPEQYYQPQQYQGSNGNPPVPQGYNPALQAQMPGSDGYAPGTATNQDQLIKQLLKTPSSELNQEQMEFLAQWELETKPKYNQRCPECDSGNFVLSGTKNAHGTFSTDKCFDCGYSTRGPVPALGGTSAGKSGASTRQIDTGGGGGPSLYMKVGNGRQIPNTYQPRGS